MPISYKAQLNLGNEALGTEKSVTANEETKTCELRHLAQEIHHQNQLIPEDVAAAVLGYFCKAAVMKMTEGFAVQLSSDGKVALRLIPDIHIKGGSINLARAKELDPTVTELTEENAGDLIDKAGGVTLKVRAIAQQPFTDLLNDQKPRVERSGVVTAAYVAKKDGTGTNTGGNGEGGNNGGGSEQGDDDLEG